VIPHSYFKVPFSVDGEVFSVDFIQDRFIVAADDDVEADFVLLLDEALLDCELGELSHDVVDGALPAAHEGHIWVEVLVLEGVDLAEVLILGLPLLEGLVLELTLGAVCDFGREGADPGVVEGEGVEVDLAHVGVEVVEAEFDLVALVDPLEVLFVGALLVLARLQVEEGVRLVHADPGGQPLVRVARAEKLLVGARGQHLPALREVLEHTLVDLVVLGARQVVVLVHAHVHQRTRHLLHFGHEDGLEAVVEPVGQLHFGLLEHKPRDLEFVCELSVELLHEALEVVHDHDFLVVPELLVHLHEGLDVLGVELRDQLELGCGRHQPVLLAHQLDLVQRRSRVQRGVLELALHVLFVLQLKYLFVRLQCR